MIKTKKKTYKELAIEFQNTKSEKTFTELYYKLRPGLRNYVLNIIKDSDVADDITSITLTKIFQKIDDYDPQWQISTWAYKIAYNQCIGWLRVKNKSVSMDSFKEKGMEASETGLMPFQTSFEYDQEFMTTEAFCENEQEVLMNKFRMVNEAIKALPPMYRPYMEECFLNKKSYNDILEIMKERERNITLQTVKNRIFRGRKIIKGQLESLSIFKENN